VLPHPDEQQQKKKREEVGNVKTEKSPEIFPGIFSLVGVNVGLGKRCVAREGEKSGRGIFPGKFF